MSENQEQFIQRKKAILSMILEICISDNFIHEVEKKYLFNAGGYYNLSPKDLEDVLRNPNSFELQPPPSERERMEILYHLLFMMRADGAIEEKEEQLVQKAGFYLGFDENLVRELIEVMKKYIKEDIPPAVMLNKIQKYMN